MSDEQALLAAILAQPDEDTPRLAYADWLDEHASTDADRARAEFIRLQIEHARGIANPRRRKLVETRTADLEQLHGETWLTAFRSACRPATKVIGRFRRGFVGRVEDGGSEPRWLAKVAATCPVQELSFAEGNYQRKQDIFAKAAECPALSRLRRLEFKNIGPVAVQEFVKSPHLTGLQWLGIDYFRDTTLTYLSRSAARKCLRELCLIGGMGRGVEPGRGMGVLLSAEWPALEGAWVQSFEWGQEGIVTLVEGFAAIKRKRLHIGVNWMSPSEILAALTAVIPGSPGSLSLWAWNPIKDAWPVAPREGRTLSILGFEARSDARTEWLTKNVPPGRFDRLAIIRCELKEPSAAALAKWPGLAQLKELDLSDNHLGDAGAIHLAESPHIEKLELLNVGKNRLTSRGKDALRKRLGPQVRVS